MIKRFCIFLQLFISSFLFAQYPVILNLSVFKDQLFSQQQKETESWYLNNARGNPSPPLSIYRYQPQDGDSLIVLASAFNLPIDTLATINGLENIRDFMTNKVLLIPSAPGLYLDTQSDSTWMKSLLLSLGETEYQVIFLKINDSIKKIRYYPGLPLPSEQKRRFVLSLFSPPLHHRVITSPYGYRNHPVTGKWGLHTGTDYRSPIGSPVYSCSDGIVLSVGKLEDYGKFIIIKHKNGYTSLYGHLNKIMVIRNQTVVEGTLIAKSGNTGISTGPHLHFEIRKNGSPVDPENLLLDDLK